MLAWQQGQPFRREIDYSETMQSQNTASIEHSSWHSMKADNEQISNEDAIKRGQQFAWGKIISASKDIKKHGGIDKLPQNSKGLKHLGQGLHALQDAVAHKGTDMANHSVLNDMDPSLEDIYEVNQLTQSAITTAEVLSGNYKHVEDGMVVKLPGVSSGQLSEIVGGYMKAMEDKKVTKITFDLQ